jgi:prepilin-type N-terminal cleavage/methylation domain-containing protein
MKLRSAQSGVTLLELMIGVAIVAILARLVSPSLLTTIALNRAAGTTNDMLTAIAYARSEAMQGGIVSLQSIGGDWNNGWEVVDAAGVVLWNYSAPNRIIVTETGGFQQFSFDNRGMLVGMAGGGTMTVCIDPASVNEDEYNDSVRFRGRQIRLVAAGRPQLTRNFECDPI